MSRLYCADAQAYLSICCFYSTINTESYVLVNLYFEVVYKSREEGKDQYGKVTNTNAVECLSIQPLFTCMLNLTMSENIISVQ